MQADVMHRGLVVEGCPEEREDRTNTCRDSYYSTAIVTSRPADFPLPHSKAQHRVRDSSEASRPEAGRCQQNNPHVTKVNLHEN